MKKYRITYKNSLIMFGNNIFTEIFETAENISPERILLKYALKTGCCGMLQLIKAEKI